jgi:DNA repair protein RadA/Sms
LPPAPRIATHIRAVDYVLGGGFVPGESHLIFGVPSCGKSTLGLQAASAAKSAVYVAADWSCDQAHAKWVDLGLPVSPNHVVVESVQAHAIAQIVRDRKPAIIVVDSWQFLQAPRADSIYQNMLQSLLILQSECQRSNTAILMLGKTRKDRNFAGHQDLLHRITGVVLRLRKLRGHKREIVVDKTRIGPDGRKFLYIDARGLRSPRVISDPSNDPI